MSKESLPEDFKFDTDNIFNELSIPFLKYGATIERLELNGFGYGSESTKSTGTVPSLSDTPFSSSVVNDLVFDQSPASTQKGRKTIAIKLKVNVQKYLFLIINFNFMI
ncbi:MAG: hypothetical protein P9L92_13975 [Candidatus Electryonea clarkiae]|nr:hypothetical protein [Candidatus Electryonea clarkiae]MDP8285451.1 hypothetical protein [Candidatus Electryonea clarkiae]